MRPLTLAITSGKGGVGKSVVATNLAEALAADGVRAALLDVDLGQGACAVLANEQPAASVADVVRRTATLDDVYHTTRGGVTLVTAAAEPGQADGREAKFYGLLDGVLARLQRDHDVVLIDTPAGVDGAVRWAIDRADAAALVLVGEPTAISDAYRLAKLVWAGDADYPLHGIANFEETEAEARGVVDRFAHVTRHFLHRDAPFLGWVPFSAIVRRSVAEQEPFVRRDSAPQRAVAALAASVVALRTAPETAAD